MLVYVIKSGNAYFGKDNGSVGFDGYKKIEIMCSEDVTQAYMYSSEKKAQKVLEALEYKSTNIWHIHIWEIEEHFNEAGGWEVAEI